MIVHAEQHCNCIGCIDHSKAHGLNSLFWHPVPPMFTKQDGLAAVANAIVTDASKGVGGEEHDRKQQHPDTADPRDKQQQQQQQQQITADRHGSSGSQKEQQQQHQVPHGIQPGTLAYKLAVAVNELSQGLSQGGLSPGVSHGTVGNGLLHHSHDDTGEDEEPEEDEDAGAAIPAAEQQQGGRPQRLRKPKQYLAENVISPTSTRGLTSPRGMGRAGSVPGTPSSTSKRKVSDSRE
jgi:hypothetical protein